MAISVGNSTSGSTNSTSSSSGTKAAPKSSTVQNLQNLLVQYATSESQDIQDMLGRVASQLGISMTDVRAAAAEDAKAQADAKAAADAAKKAKEDQGPSAASIASKKHLQTEKVRQAAEEYRRHRLNSWWPSFASRSS